jgi:hypothetical protein
MDKTNHHPLSNQRRLPVEHRIEKCGVGLIGVGDLGIVARDDVVRERAYTIDVPARREVLEGADADMASCDAGQHCPRKWGFARYRLTCRHDAKGACRRDTKGRHRFTNDIFTQYRTERSAAVALT